MSRFRFRVLGLVVSGARLTAVGSLAWLWASGCTSTAQSGGTDGGGAGDAGEDGGGADAGDSANGGSGGARAGGLGGLGGWGAGGNLGGLGDAGEGGAAAAGECMPNATEQCWETPEGAPLPDEPDEAKGDCRFGVRTCGASATWGACLGAVAPGDEDSCEPGADENCNGEPNEGCPCTEGEMRACGSDTGNCEQGTQSCENAAWSACEGGVTPAAQDSCVEQGDDADCDGVANDGCPCVGTETEECGECGERTCQPEARDWGACKATAETTQCWATEDGTPLSGSATDTGNCTPGTRTCEAGGNFGACVGAIGRASKDVCSVAGDDATCDGVSNGGCPCTGTQTRACGSAVGACRQGTQSCVSGAWGECDGDVEPAQQDRCDVAGDDSNCNDRPNEGCPCIGSQSQTCNDCGTQVCDPAKRAWGACKPSASPPATRCGSATSVQTCDSAGRWASTTCTTADSHCSPRCAVSGGKASCVVEAKDVDGDTYPDALCAATPGNDCDDSRPSVYPGATEMCDALDNDCDGTLDLRDGLTLSGNTATTPDRRYWDIAWHPTSDQFGMVGNGPTQGIFFGAIAAAQGTLNLQPTTFVPNLSDYSRPRLAYSASAGTGTGVGGYGVVYDEGNKGGVSIRWQAVAPNGTPGPNLYTADGRQGVSIATLSNNDFAVAFTGGSAVHFGRLQPAMGITNATSVAEAANYTRIAANGAESVIVYQLASSTTIKSVRASATYVLGTPQSLTTTGQKPDIAATPTGYAVAWSTAAGIAFNLLNTAGTRVCGPTNAQFGNGTLDSLDAVAVEHTAYGTVVFGIDGAGEMRVFRFNGSCQLIDFQTLLPTPVAPNTPNMAVGGGKLVITWDADAKGHLRIMNERLCQ